jgi:hypothetical protein
VELNDRQSPTPLPSPRLASAASAPACLSTATTTLIILQQSTPLAVAAALARLAAKTQVPMQANKSFLPSAALLTPSLQLRTEQLHPARARSV